MLNRSHAFSKLEQFIRELSVPPDGDHRQREPSRMRYAPDLDPCGYLNSPASRGANTSG